MGLVVLPKRLKEEMNLLKEVLLNRKTEDALNEEPLLKHRAWGGRCSYQNTILL